MCVISFLIVLKFAWARDYRVLGFTWEKVNPLLIKIILKITGQFQTYHSFLMAMSDEKQKTCSTNKKQCFWAKQQNTRETETKTRNEKHVFRACSKFTNMFLCFIQWTAFMASVAITWLDNNCHGVKVFFFASRVYAWNSSDLKTCHNRLNLSLYLKLRLHQMPLHYIYAKIPSVLCIKLSQPVW